MVKEELLDEANEKIIKKLDDILGCQGNKEVLRNILRYKKIVQTMPCNIEFENYNIIIRNESSYNSFEYLLEVISEIYQKNNIINKTGIYNINSDDLNEKRRGKTKIKEGIILINFIELGVYNIDCYKKKIFELIYKMPDRVFIIIEDYYRDEDIIANFNTIFSWNMKIEKITLEEKSKYSLNFFKRNKIKCSEKLAEEISDKPFYLLKSDLINYMVTCKSKNIKDVAQIIDKNNKNDNEKISGEEELNRLIGVEDVKKQITKVINYIKNSKNRKNMPMLHMCFTGNPGTGKTTVARIVGKIFEEEKILSTGKFVEAQRADLIGEYIGQTAPKTQNMVRRAKGGVLFIDEAYNLNSVESPRDYGRECIATLIKEMEDKRDDLCVILAGYTKEMDNLLNVNPGFKSRIQFIINFPDYNTEELYMIFKKICKEENYKISPNVKNILIDNFERAKKEDNFGNGRYVRNLFEKVKFEQADRVVKNNSKSVNLITKNDIINAINTIIFKEKEVRKIGF